MAATVINMDKSKVKYVRATDRLDATQATQATQAAEAAPPAQPMSATADARPPAQGLRMYVVVNGSLKMGKGKIVAQAGHAVAAVTEYLVSQDPALLRAYKMAGQPIIVLEAKQEDMAALEALRIGVAIHDAGRTQVDPGSLTALAFVPSPTHPHAMLASMRLL